MLPEAKGAPRAELGPLLPLPARGQQSCTNVSGGTGFCPLLPSLAQATVLQRPPLPCFSCRSVSPSRACSAPPLAFLVTPAPGGGPHSTARLCCSPAGRVSRPPRRPTPSEPGEVGHTQWIFQMETCQAGAFLLEPAR